MVKSKKQRMHGNDVRVVNDEMPAAFHRIADITCDLLGKHTGTEWRYTVVRHTRDNDSLHIYYASKEGGPMYAIRAGEPEGLPEPHSSLPRAELLECVLMAVSDVMSVLSTRWIPPEEAPVAILPHAYPTDLH